MSNETKLPDASDIVSPTKLAHVVLRTNNLKAMAPFYEVFLGGKAAFKNDYTCFITYDEEHHRVAIVQLPGLAHKLSKSCGLDVRRFHSVVKHSDLLIVHLAYCVYVLKYA